MPSYTPSRGNSEYFDAPVAIFDKEDDDSSPPSEPIMSSQDIAPSPPRRRYQLHDDGPQSQKPETHVFSTYDTQPQKSARVIAHPNGSEGWLPVDDEADQDLSSQATPSSKKGSPIQRSRSVSPYPIRQKPPVPQGFANGSINRQDTVHTSNRASPHSFNHGSVKLSRSASRKSNHTTSDGRMIPGSAFVNGAGVTGPLAVAAEDDDLVLRNAEATAQLTPKQKTKIAKSEAKQNKKLSKIIKGEGKTEKKALDTTIHELAELQKYQKQAVKSEGRAQATHSKLLSSFKKTESAFLHAKAAYETALAQLHVEAENLETLRNSAREATEKMQDKSAEVDSLRTTLAVDEREREVKLTQLKGSSKGSHGRRASMW